MPSDTRQPDRVSTAVVMANGVEMTYRRCESGRMVLVLGASEAIALALGASFRVIMPEMPFRFSDAAAAGWLGGVCDGLGIAEAVIVAEAGPRRGARACSRHRGQRFRY